MIDTFEAAERLGVTTRRMRELCRQRRVPGAKLLGRSWFVPADFKIIAGTRGPKLGQ